MIAFGMRRLLLGGIACSLIAAGCGGSSSGGGQEQTLNFGRIAARLIGTAQPPVVASGLGSIVTGVAGANITQLTLTTPPGTLADTRIAYYAVDNQSPGLYLISPSGGAPYRVWTGGFGNSEPTWSRDGTQIVGDGSVRSLMPSSTITDGTSNTVFTSEANVAANPSNITVVLGDGSVRNVTATGKDTNPAWWPANRITFESYRDGNSEIYVMNTDGTGVTRLTNNLAADTSPCWSPDGNKIAYVSNRNGRQEIFQMISDGTSNTLLISEAAGNCWDPQYSPDGTKICYVTNKDGNSEIYVADVNGLNRTRLTNNTLSEFDPSWSPDGSQIAYTRINAAGTSEIWTVFPNNLKQIGIATHGARPYWSPFVSRRTLIGSTNASLGASASGILFGQRGDATTSILSFNTTTPGGARINKLTADGVNAPNFAFEVTTADAITSMQYLNDFYQRPVIAVVSAPEAPSTITGAIVTFNSSSGEVSSVLPYTANRSSGKAAAAAGTTVTYRRQFAGVWDARGKNLSPNGAAEVRIDTRTGKLLSFR